MGTAGGLRHFREQILSGNPNHILLMHCDIVCTFPLKELLDFHRQHGKECSILGKKVPKEEAGKYGCLIIDEATNEVVHYAEKPETFVGDTINAGIYVFSPQFFDLIAKGTCITHIGVTEWCISVGGERIQYSGEDEGFLRLEQDVFQKICGDKHVYAYLTPDFWVQLKSAG